MSKILYVLLLEDNKYFVYYTLTNIHEVVLFECQLLNFFVRKYNPINIVEQNSYVEIEDIDKYVKKYMNLFGIDNVRGGSYSNEILEDYKIQTLQSELNFLKNHENNNNDMYLFLYNEMLKYQDINEIEKFDIKKNKYVYDKQELEKFQYYKFNNCKCKIDFSRIENIQWIKNIIENNPKNVILNYRNFKKNEDLINKYKELIEFLKYLTKLNCEYREINFGSLPSLYFINPIVIFDNYIFSDDVDKKNINKDDAKMVCDKFEEFFYWTINQISELEFDINNSMKNIEYKNDLVHYVYEQKIMSQKKKNSEKEED